MKVLRQFLATAGGALALTAATADTASAAEPAWQDYFTEVSKAWYIPVYYPGRGQSNITTAVVDLNGDGRKDIVLHLYAHRYDNGETGPKPQFNKVVLLIQQANGRFIDQTKTMLIGSRDLGGGSRKVKIGDLNGDGRPDLVYAVSQEDGRNLFNAHNADAQLAAVISVPGGYKVTRFGRPNWYHSVNIGQDASGRSFAMGEGFSQPSAQYGESFYFDANGAAIPTGLQLPTVSAGSFEIYNKGGLAFKSDTILQGGSSYPNYYSAEGFRLMSSAGAGTWSKLSSLAFGTVVGTANLLYPGNPNPAPGPVLNIRGKNIFGGAIFENCKIHMQPGAAPSVVFHLGAGLLPDFYEGITVKQSDLKPFSTFVAARVAGDKIVPVTLNLRREVQIDNNVNFFDCKDVNADGYEDLVVYPYGSQVQVYLNGPTRRFEYQGTGPFPPITDVWQYSATTILEDMDGDGIADLLVFPANGMPDQLTGRVPCRLYKGKKQLGT